MSKLLTSLNMDLFSKHNQEYPVWDPMLLYDGDKWLVYVLSTNTKRNQGLSLSDFFTTENYIHGFSSRNFIDWQDLGKVIVGQNEEERICAGSLIKENGTIYFFYSSTIKQFSADLLDQRVFLATSVDGSKFKLDEEFSLLPDQSMYPTKCFNPKTGEMLFAWRDPYIFKDPKSGKYYLFICAGAQRWGVAPQVAVAVADQVTGPYQLLPPAAEPKIHIDGQARTSLGELERVQVLFYRDKYYMFCSSWKSQLSPEMVKLAESLGYKISDSTIYVLSSDNVEGPYEFDLEHLIVRNSSYTGFYGSWLVPSLEEEGATSVVGWYTQKFEVNLTKPFRFVQNGEDCYLVDNNALGRGKLKFQVNALKSQLKSIFMKKK